MYNMFMEVILLYKDHKMYEVNVTGFVTLVTSILIKIIKAVVSNSIKIV